MIQGAAFENILPLLVSTYQQGRLVPFLGAGMSAPRLTLWEEFLGKLEQKAGLRSSKGKVSPDARAQRACTVIKNRDGRAGFLKCVREALKGNSREEPKSIINLAKTPWPLVISTNYDDLFFYACLCRHEGTREPSDEIPVQILSRSARDCKLVISSLTGPFDREYIWHVQGFLGGQSRDGHLMKDIPARDIEALQDQLVIGHSEYRRVTNRAPDFRRCFTEVFNTRSFLFLGSSLKEEYFLNLFGEALDLCGPSAVPHFAFTKEGEVDTDFLADQMNITVCEFPKGSDWNELPKWLDRLKEEIDKPKARSTGWSFAIGPDSGAKELKPDLEVVCGCAPGKPLEHEAVAFVAIREENLPVPPKPFEHVKGYLRPTPNEHIFEYRDDNLYAVTARCKGNEDDSAVWEATKALLEMVTTSNRGITTLHFQFSGTGGTVPPIFGFIEVVRTFGDWRATTEGRKSDLRLVLYIQSDVELSLTSGRVDIPELLASRLIRFWVVIVMAEGQEPVRRAMHCRADASVEEVLKNVDVPSSPDWIVTVCPSPRKRFSEKRTTRDVHMLQLVQMGISFGSVLILEKGKKEKRKNK